MMFTLPEFFPYTVSNLSVQLSEFLSRYQESSMVEPEPEWGSKKSRSVLGKLYT